MSSFVDPTYQYAAEVLRWVDGDTVDVVIDLGFKVTIAVRLRLWGLDTPERAQAGYQEARQFSDAFAPAGSKVVVKTHRVPEKYGRYLAELYVGTDKLNDLLVEQGHAKSYFGAAR